jgi:type IV secretory pathway VirB4 component
MNKIFTYFNDLKTKVHDMKAFEITSPVRSLIPSSLIVSDTHIQTPNKFYRIYHICDMPTFVSIQQTLSLLQSNIQFTISTFAKKVPANEMKKGLKSARSGLMANLISREERGSIDTIELQNQTAILTEAEQKLSMNLTSYFDTSMYIRIEANTLEEIKAIDIHLKSIIENTGYGIRVGGFDQKEHLLATMPIARNKSEISIRVDTDVLKNMQTMITKDRFSITAPFLGFNLIDGSAIFKSPRDEATPHVAILGHNGSGKTFTAMLMSLRMMYTGEQQIFIDVEKQFSPYVKQLGYKVLEVNNQNGFNMFWIPNYHLITTDKKRNKIESDHAQAIVGSLQIIIQESANICNIGILSQIIGLYYQEVKFDNRNLDHFITSFLPDLLKKQTFEANHINSILNGIKPFATGGIYGGLLTGKGGYEFDEEMVCIDCSSITFKSKSLKVPIMFLIFQMFTNLIDTDRTKKRRIVLDEVHLYFQNKVIGEFLIEFAKMARKRNAGGTFITQESLGMTAENGGLTLMSQSGTHILFFCPKSTVKDFKDKGLFNIDKDTEHRITNFEQAQCLYLTKKDKFYLKVHTFQEELDLITSSLEAEN